jgi:hypothetical protein
VDLGGEQACRPPHHALILLKVFVVYLILNIFHQAFLESKYPHWQTSSAFPASWHAQSNRDKWPVCPDSKHPTWDAIGTRDSHFPKEGRFYGKTRYQDCLEDIFPTPAYAPQNWACSKEQKESCDL